MVEAPAAETRATRATRETKAEVVPAAAVLGMVLPKLLSPVPSVVRSVAP